MPRNGLDSLAVSHACATIRHTPASLMRSRASTPRFVSPAFSVISQAASATALLPKTWASEPRTASSNERSLVAASFYPQDEGLHRLALRRPGGRIKRRIGVEIGGEHFQRGLLPGRPTKAAELPGNQRLDRVDISAVLVRSHDPSLSVSRQGPPGAPAHSHSLVHALWQAVASAGRQPG
jgi:hypothetical protein